MRTFACLYLFIDCLYSAEKARGEIVRKKEGEREREREREIEGQTERNATVKKDRGQIESATTAVGALSP